MATEEEKQKKIDQIDWDKIEEWDTKYRLHLRSKFLMERAQDGNLYVRYLRALRQ